MNGPKYIVRPCVRCSDLVQQRGIGQPPVCKTCFEDLGKAPAGSKTNCDACGDNWAMPMQSYCEVCYKEKWAKVITL